MNKSNFLSFNFLNDKIYMYFFFDATGFVFIYVFVYLVVSMGAEQAIELALHGRQHDVINFGTQTGGMCKKYGINKVCIPKLTSFVSLNSVQNKHEK